MAEEIAAALRSQALEAGNGELLWPGPTAIEAAAHLARSSLAVLGGEVYQTGLTQGWGTFVRSWSTNPGWNDDESWERFLDRGLAQATEEIRGELRAGRTNLFFLATCGKVEYAQQWRGLSA
jgi:hypothetical protein